MVSNYDRIYNEINKEAHSLGPGHNIDAEELVKLVMEIVDLVDQHRIRSIPRINQRITALIQNGALNLMNPNEQ